MRIQGLAETDHYIISITDFIGFVSSDAILSVLASSKLSFASYQPIDN